MYNKEKQISSHRMRFILWLLNPWRDSSRSILTGLPTNCLTALAGPCHLPSHPTTWPMPSTSRPEPLGHRTTSPSYIGHLPPPAAKPDLPQSFFALSLPVLATLDSPCHLVWGHLSTSLPGCGMPPMHGIYWKLGHPPLHPEGEEVRWLTLPAWFLMSISLLRHPLNHLRTCLHRCALWPSSGWSNPVAGTKRHRSQRAGHPHHQFLLGGLTGNHTHPRKKKRKSPKSPLASHKPKSSQCLKGSYSQISVSWIIFNQFYEVNFNRSTIRKDVKIITQSSCEAWEVCYVSQAGKQHP